VHVVGWPFVPTSEAPALEPRDEAAELSAQLLEEAAAHARTTAPSVRVSSRTLWGATGPVLLAESARAAWLILGRRDRHHPGHALTDSVPAALAAHAQCPLVVVPQEPQGGRITPRLRVVCGDDGSATAAAALDFARAFAAVHGAEMETVSSTHARLPEGLAGAAASAMLLVVGRRENDTQGRLLSSLSRSVLFSSRCPVVVVAPQSGY